MRLATRRSAQGNSSKRDATTPSKTWASTSVPYDVRLARPLSKAGLRDRERLHFGHIVEVSDSLTSAPSVPRKRTKAGSIASKSSLVNRPVNLRRRIRRRRSKDNVNMKWR